jgi:hypothetical protein
MSAAPLTPEERPRVFRYPQKAAPGRYEVSISSVGYDGITVRFKTERDALRFFEAAERGQAVAR